MVKFDPLSGTAHTIDDSTLWYSQTMQVRSPLCENIKSEKADTGKFEGHIINDTRPHHNITMPHPKETVGCNSPRWRIACGAGDKWLSLLASARVNHAHTLWKECFPAQNTALLRQSTQGSIQQQVTPLVFTQNRPTWITQRPSQVSPLGEDDWIPTMQIHITTVDQWEIFRIQYMEVR